MSGARGGDESRDATRRTWRDEVSGHGAARRIEVAQQPASTRPDLVVARSAQRVANWSCLCFAKQRRSGNEAPFAKRRSSNKSRDT